MPEGTVMQSPALPHPEPGSAQLDGHRIRQSWWAESSSMGLAAFKASALHRINMALKIRQKQESCCSWIIGWHPLSLVLPRLIFETGHLSQRLLFQSHFAHGAVHFSLPSVIPQMGFTPPTCIIQNKQQYKYKISWQTSVKLFWYNPVNTPAIQQSTESISCFQFKQKYWSHPSILLEGKPKTSGNSKRNGLCFEQGSSLLQWWSDTSITVLLYSSCFCFSCPFSSSHPC